METSAKIDPQTLHAAQAFISALSGRFAVSAAILFGSRARQSHHQDSDADLALLLPEQPGGWVATKLAMADIAYDVLLATGIRIQPLPIWEDEWRHPEDHANPLLLKNIEREGIRL